MIDTSINHIYYKKSGIMELDGNPLIESLNPMPVSIEETIKRLSRLPDFDESERNFPGPYRSLMAERLKNFFIPLMKHVEILQRIYINVLTGYSSRNPMTPNGQRFLHNIGGEKGKQVEYNPGRISVLTGPTGMGKSSLIKQIFQSIGSPVIIHEKYDGKVFTETQILYLLTNVPEQSSAKNLCKNLIEEINRKLGKYEIFKNFEYRTNTRTDFVLLLRKLVANHHVGAIIIDDFQNVSSKMSGGKRELSDFLHNLRDELGVPIFIVGTYDISEVIKKSASNARRFSDGGWFELARPMSSDDIEWRAFCTATWEYQWVRKPIQISDEIINELYDISQGLSGFMLNLFVDAQQAAILNGKDTVDTSILKKVYGASSDPLKKVIETLKNGKLIRDYAYNDLFPGHLIPDRINEPTRLEKLLKEKQQKIEKEKLIDDGLVEEIPRKSKKKKSKADFGSIRNQVLGKSDDK